MPFVYELDDAFHPTIEHRRRCDRALGDPDDVAAAAAAVAAQDRWAQARLKNFGAVAIWFAGPGRSAGHANSQRTIHRRTVPSRSRHRGEGAARPPPRRPAARAWSTSGTPRSADRVQAAGAKAVATSSAAINASLGQPDTNAADIDLVFSAIARISAAGARARHRRHRGRLRASPPRTSSSGCLAAGAVGGNLEDSDHVRPGELVDVGEFAERIAAVRAAATASGVDLVINARVDTFLRAGDRDPEAVVLDTIERGRRYLEAGASCVYPIRLTDPILTTRLVDALPGPLNANIAPGVTVADLAAAGASRVSLGARPFFVAMAAFEELAAQMLGGTGLSEHYDQRRGQAGEVTGALTCDSASSR